MFVVFSYSSDTGAFLVMSIIFSPFSVAYFLTSSIFKSHLSVCWLPCRPLCDPGVFLIPAYFLIFASASDMIFEGKGTDYFFSHKIACPLFEFWWDEVYQIHNITHYYL